MKTTRVLFVMALVLAMGMQAEAKKVSLKYQFQAGDQFKYETSMKQEIAQEMMGQTQNTTVLSGATYEFKVKEVKPDGNYLMNASLVVFSMSTTTPMGEMKYNSATDTVVPDFAKSTAATMNEVYSFTLSQLGKVSDVQAPEGLVEKVNKIVEGLGSDLSGMTGATTSAAATPEGFRKTIQGMIMLFPEGGAEVKQPWEAEDQVSQMVIFNTKSKYELVKSSKDANELKVTVQITQDPSSPSMEMQGMNITYELTGAREGSMLLDPVTGLIKTSEGVTSISGTISIDSPQLPSPMSVPMTIRSTEKVVKK